MAGWCAPVLLLLWLASAAAGPNLGDVMRRDTGDTFHLHGESCGASQCAEHGASASSDNIADGCACVCPQRAPLFREDRELCVDDLPECSLATFGSGNSGVQRIPFVFLPLKGQIIHPSNEITFQGVKAPICAVSGAQFLTRKGFVDLRNTVDADVPFNLFRDEGRTFLQWSGEYDVRLRMSGRVMIVRLLCRDVAAPLTAPLDLRGVFTPCVAFRVQGTSARQLTNVTEVQFATNAHTLEVTTSTSGLSVSEYVAIGISSLLLGLIYVASVFLYLHIKKRRKAASENANTQRKLLKGIKRKDGMSLTEHDIVRINNERVQSFTNVMDSGDSGVLKKNPLLTMSRQFQDMKSSFQSESGSNISDSDDFPDNNGNNDRFNSQVISAIIHPKRRELRSHNEILSEAGTHREESGIERLPDEHVSIVETTDDREISRPVGTTRRKLYFNPAYFEPQLMAEPPPAALEFLTKIREVITIAKHKMAAKRFQPVLNEIPEEETYPSRGNSIELYQGLGSQRSGSVVSLKKENSRKRSISCVGCPGCKFENNNDFQNIMNYDNIPTCANCMKNNRGEKQNSIRKWLENIPTIKQQTFHNDTLSNLTQNNSLVNSLLSLPYIDNNSKVIKHNSFTLLKYPARGKNFVMESKNSSTLSVRSEPPIRNYNLPLPEFENIENHNNNYKYHGQTISRVNDIKPVGLSDYRPGSCRNNILFNQRKNKFITNKNALPDMVNEAIALDHCTKSYSQSSSDEERLYNKIPNNLAQRTIARKSESPQGHDYETDSLERSSKRKGLTTPTEYADVPSSQASPSLSNALPLEEELTMRNDVYKRHGSNSNTPSPSREICKPQNLYETIGEIGIVNHKIKDESIKKQNKSSDDYSLVTEVYVNNNYNFGSTPTSPSGSECSMGSRKRFNNIHNELIEKPGCLTIEVKDPPENYIKIHESDGFEPDTLDRKHTKHKEILESIQFSRKDLLKHINNSNLNNTCQMIQLRSSGTFKKPNALGQNEAKFCSLRVVNEQRTTPFIRPKLSTDVFTSSKSIVNNSDENYANNTFDWDSEEGRILTLELRHSKRQRQCTPPTIKQIKSLPRPDILPPLPPTDDNTIYEQPTYPPRRVEMNKKCMDPNQKNVNGRSLSPRTFTNNMIIEHVNRKPKNYENSIKHFGLSCSPMRASVQAQNSDYENFDGNMAARNSKISESCRTSTKKRPNSNIIENVKNNKLINTNTFVKNFKHDNNAKTRFRRKKVSSIEDSGYLSSDSTSSRQIQRKIVVPKVISSESDDTENEARSESGAESVETHSVFFGSFRKLQRSEINSIFENDETPKAIFLRETVVKKPNSLNHNRKM